VKVALISDIHANLPALEAVLMHARHRGAEAIWNAGDLVGYAPFPEEVVRQLQAEHVLNIVGDDDLSVLDVKSQENPRRRRYAEKILALRWTYEHLSGESRRYLFFLPREIRWTVEGWRVLITHTSPASYPEILTRYTPKKRLRQLAKSCEADLVICGHSHRAFARHIKDVWFVNPGSVGCPEDGDPRASYMLLKLKPGSLKIHRYRLDYDIPTVTAAIRQHGLPETFVQIFTQGQSLDTVRRMSAVTREVTQLKEDPTMASVLDLAERCEYDPLFAYHVAQLALKLFDGLYPLHNLGAEARRWLHYAAWLHNIGWIGGKKKHHKRALRLIQKDPYLRFNKRERLIIGTIVRYHRKALPKQKHAHFAALSPKTQGVVIWLAGIMRVASGLNYTHRGLVEVLTCEITNHQVILHCKVRKAADAERDAALKKARLLEIASGRKLEIRLQVRP
jgi:putative phosphoesterase